MKKLHQHLENNLSWYKKWHEHKHHRMVHYSALIISIILVVLSIIPSNPSIAVGNTYYVAPNVSAGAGAGTLTSPWNIFKLETLALAPGDIVYLRGGTYTTIKSTNQYIQLHLQNINGTAANPIKILAYQDEKPVFDFTNFTPTTSYVAAVYLSNVNYLHLKGLRITRLKQVADGSGISYGIRGEYSNNNVLEQLEIDHIGGGGIMLWNSNNNLIKNTDVHHVDDRYSQGDNWGGADAIAFSGPTSNPNLSTGNTLDGVRMWLASDDGVDLFGHNGTITIKNTWSFWNGYYQDDNMSTKQPACTAGHCGNGGGFKLGPPGTDFSNQAPKRTIYNTLAFENTSEGYNQNSSSTHILSQMFNNIAYKNGTIGFQFQYNNGSTLSHIFKNNISYDNPENIRYDNFTTTSSTNTKNSWNTGVATVNNADFQSISSVGMNGPRQANGDLPNLPFLKLITGSDLIDKGVSITTPVTIPFSGSFPDLGAFETGGATPPPTNLPPTASAGPDQTITLPTNSVTLSGSGTDPENGPLTYLWAKTSGGTATITTPTGTSTIVTGLTQGTYTFELKVTDNGNLTATDTISISVNPTPPPTVVPDLTLSLSPNPLLMPYTSSKGDVTVNVREVGGKVTTGSITVHIPKINGLTVSKLSGQNWTFSSTNANYYKMSTNTTIPANGTKSFILRYRKNTQHYYNSPVTEIQIISPSGGETNTSNNTASLLIETAEIAIINNPPTANAGQNQTITLPTNSVTLSGSGIDTDGTIASYLWTKVSGSGTIISPSQAITTVTGLIEGTSTFRLTVTDNLGDTGSATVNVTVNAAANNGSFTFQPLTIVQNSNGRLRPQVVISSPNTITKVDFFLGTTLIGSDVSTQSPFDINGGVGYDSTQIANGTYSLTARAYDNLGNNDTSVPLSVTITN